MFFPEEVFEKAVQKDGNAFLEKNSYQIVEKYSHYSLEKFKVMDKVTRETFHYFLYINRYKIRLFTHQTLNGTPKIRFDQIACLLEKEMNEYLLDHQKYRLKVLFQQITVEKDDSILDEPPNMPHFFQEIFKKEWRNTKRVNMSDFFSYFFVSGLLSLLGIFFLVSSWSQHNMSAILFFGILEIPISYIAYHVFLCTKKAIRIYFFMKKIRS